MDLHPFQNGSFQFYYSYNKSHSEKYVQLTDIYFSFWESSHY